MYSSSGQEKQYVQSGAMMQLRGFEMLKEVHLEPVPLSIEKDPCCSNIIRLEENCFNYLSKEECDNVHSFIHTN
jgi:hypothetical protein